MVLRRRRNEAHSSSAPVQIDDIALEPTGDISVGITFLLTLARFTTIGVLPAPRAP